VKAHLSAAKATARRVAEGSRPAVGSEAGHLDSVELDRIAFRAGDGCQTWVAVRRGILGAGLRQLAKPQHLAEQVKGPRIRVPAEHGQFGGQLGRQLVGPAHFGEHDLERVFAGRPDLLKALGRLFVRRAGFAAAAKPLTRSLPRTLSSLRKRASAIPMAYASEH